MSLANWRFRMPPMKGILAAGQSNKVGRGSPLDTAIDVGGPGVYQWTRGGALARIAPGNDPIDHVGQTGLVGSSVSFARRLVAETGWTVCLLPGAEGGTSFWQNKWNPGDPNYLYAVQLANTFLQHEGNELICAEFQHGEGDTDNQDATDAYAARQEAMIAGMRQDIVGAENLPFLIGGMCPDWVAGNARREQMQAILADTPNRVTNTAYVDPTGLTGNVDANIHYSAANQRILGYERSWAAWVTVNS